MCRSGGGYNGKDPENGSGGNDIQLWFPYIALFESRLLQVCAFPDYTAPVDKVCGMDGGISVHAISDRLVENTVYAADRGIKDPLYDRDDSQYHMIWFYNNLIPGLTTINKSWQPYPSHIW